MKLVLVDTSNVRCCLSGKQKMFLTIKREEMLNQVLRNQDQNSGKVRSKLMPQILTDEIGSHDIILQLQWEKQRLEVTLEKEQMGTNLQRDCVLQNLLERFPVQDVKISIFLKYAPRSTGSLSDFASLQDLTIQPKRNNLACVGYVKTNKTWFDPEPALHAKIIAEVPYRLGESGQLFFNKLIFEQEAFSDVTIIAENGAKVKSHRCFLSVRSPVLQAMFQNWTKESQTSEIDMTDISEKGVKAFLYYIYFENLEPPRDDIGIAFEMFKAAEKYDMQMLKNEMITILKNKRNDKFEVKVAFNMYMFTRNMESDLELKSKARQVLKERYNDLEELQEYKDLFEKNPKVAMEVIGDFMKSSWA